MWVNKRHAARPVFLPFVAVKIETGTTILLVVTAYDVRSNDGQATSGGQLRGKLGMVEGRTAQAEGAARQASGPPALCRL